ncbi:MULTISPECIES: hypothetical protein [Lactiplantibacillus]|uniref:hypothetical protein n=1 Tax=Lactiplantibacillus TaxID=2767842 RepID=UPI001C2766BB|nr:hypothetical protein [Lactiplantibacillus plantarum]MBU8890725.1 hypothetical protein [Lactiplantibacillus plantarum]MBW2757803.1 hypothetical protein [Lactiplantibacillus plantarum]
MKSIDKCVSNKISNLNLFLSIFIVAVITIGLIWILSLVMKKVLPQTYKILAGGR